MHTPTNPMISSRFFYQMIGVAKLLRLRTEYCRSIMNEYKKGAQFALAAKQWHEGFNLKIPVHSRFELALPSRSTSIDRPILVADLIVRIFDDASISLKYNEI